MSLQLDWFGLAEGAAFDLQGRPTFVSFAPQALASTGFPAVMTPTFVFLVQDDEDPEPILVSGSRLTVKFECRDPEGEAILLVQQQIEIADKQDPRLPNRVQAVAQLPIQASKPGMYEISGELTVEGTGQTLRASKVVPILEPRPV